MNSSKYRSLAEKAWNTLYPDQKITGIRLWLLIRRIRVLEFALGAALGEFRMTGLSGVKLTKSKGRKNPYLLSRTSVMVNRFVGSRPDLCRLVPSSDEEYNVERVVAFVRSFEERGNGVEYSDPDTEFLSDINPADPGKEFP